MTRSLRALSCLVLSGVGPVLAAQTCPCPPAETPGWHGSLGAGLALTSGNSDTRSYNLAFAAKHDTKGRNLFKADGLYLRGENEGETTVDKTALGVRDEYKLSERAYVFGEVRYLRDEFKQIDYLVSPVAGVGVKLLAREDLALQADAALGGVFEQLLGLDSTTSGALQASEALAWKLSPSASFTQGFSALWKLDDFEDALYRLSAGLTTSVSSRLELKLAYARDIKNRPPLVTLKKSDDSFIATLVYKF